MMNILKFICSKPFLKHMGLALLLIVIIVFIVLWWLRITTRHGEYTIVPNLSKQSVDEVVQTLKKSDLRYEVLDSATYTPDYPVFSVIEQNPQAGAKVKAQRKIYLTINPSGYRKVTVPNVIQVTRRNAESIIKAIGLKVGRISYIDDIGKDMVLGLTYKDRELHPGELLPKTSTVDLVCGNGNLPNDELTEESYEEAGN